jgi:uncharacterized NAD(P)/FAD-binding protein YdhS
MKRLAVVGGGAAGVLVVVQLARRLPVEADVEVVLFDDSGRVARGAAYSTTDQRHLLNVPAGRMSAVDGDEEHFLRWVRRNHPDATGEDYQPRCQYGDYLAQCLAKHARACRLVVRHARVTDLARSDGRWWVGHERGADVVDAVVLAPGHSPPTPVPAFGRDADDYVADPWSPGALDRLLARTGSGDLIVTVGTGLTAIDVALTLVPSGRRVLALSRHGLLPAAQRPTMAAPSPLAVPADGHSLTVAELESLVVQHVESVVAAGGDWRSAVDGLRPVTSELWRRLPPGERSAFLAGPARRWETVRHRMAPAVAAEIAAFRDDGRFEVRAGTLIAALCSPGRSVLTVRGRDGALSRITAAAVVNCTGPTCDIDRYPGGFGHRLVERGLVRRDALGLGIDATDEGLVVDAAGDIDRSFGVVGALRRGSLYESTAIPELRSQAASIVDAMAVGLVGDRPESIAEGARATPIRS